MSAGRLRLVLALLAAAIVLPSALLVARALRGAAAEESGRHRAVAERIFDEMERALSELVAREEERPVAAFRANAGGRITAYPEEPFVLGYFEVAPDGSVTTPLAPRDADGLRAVTTWFAARAADSPAPEADLAKGQQAPGTTVRADEVRLEEMEFSRGEFHHALGYVIDAPAAKSAPKDAYDALQSLNRGAEERASRKRKVLADASGAASGDLEQMPETPAAAPAREAATQEAMRRNVARVAVDPLIGRLADPRHLLLYRSVFHDGSAVRQGLVIDVEALGADLRERVLGENRLPGAALAFASDAAAAPALDAPDAWKYRHRFGEPFDAISASLELAPLAGSDGSVVIYALAALLAVTGAAGLFAVYRMVTVAMAFAERRSNFVAAVSHELKTPLTAIRMYGEMLRDELVPTEAKRLEYYGTITAESERLSRLIDNVLEFSRLEKGTREMRLSVGQIGPIVEEVIALLRPHAERAGFTLRSAIDPELPPVRFERDALLQVLVNLIDNALKYASSATAREIAIACRRHGDGVLLCVRDHGPGVAHRQLTRIFEPFHRGQDELVRTTQGTGLGLALVKSLIERMGGAVSGRNAADGGFEVRVALPRAS
jgi:signal transduction histidine kinase